jgi:hypothetical protein
MSEPQLRRWGNTNGDIIGGGAVHVRTPILDRGVSRSGFGEWSGRPGQSVSTLNVGSPRTKVISRKSANLVYADGADLA